MAASQVVLYFDRQEDALLFTLAASSAMASEGVATDAGLKMAKEISKASRITTEGALKSEEGAGRPQRCA